MDAPKGRFPDEVRISSLRLVVSVVITLPLGILIPGMWMGCGGSTMSGDNGLDTQAPEIHVPDVAEIGYDSGQTEDSTDLLDHAAASSDEDTSALPDEAVADPGQDPDLGQDLDPGPSPDLATCTPSTIKCDGLVPMECAPDGSHWVAQDPCPVECYGGSCAVVLDGGIQSGDITAPGRKVIVKGSVKVAPWDGSPGSGRLRIEADAIVIEGTIDAVGSGHRGGGERHETHGAAGSGGSGVQAGQPGGDPAACGADADKMGGPGGNGGAGGGDSAGDGGQGGPCGGPDWTWPGAPGGNGGDGGYGAAGVNDDTSIDDMVWMGSGA
ncbi:MAG: hypothetical protein GXP54_01805, partial [Deltaproteobacteria bacterium]|nr:hypothetical protein [Deltaproteobacteria bacterium]